MEQIQEQNAGLLECTQTRQTENQMADMEYGSKQLKHWSQEHEKQLLQVLDTVMVDLKEQVPNHIVEITDVFKAVKVACCHTRLEAEMQQTGESFPPSSDWLMRRMRQEWCGTKGHSPRDEYTGQTMWNYATMPVPAGEKLRMFRGELRDAGHECWSTEDFLKHPQAQAAHLTVAEIVGLRLYTGPGCHAINRAAQANSGRFTCTQWAIDCAIGKLATLQSQHSPSVLFFSSIPDRLPPIWTEWYNDPMHHPRGELIITAAPPVHAVDDLAVAVKSSQHSMLVIHPFSPSQTMPEHLSWDAADVSWVSQFPQRKTFLFPSNTFMIPVLEPKGRDHLMHDVVKAPLQVCEMWPMYTWDHERHCPWIASNDSHTMWAMGNFLWMMLSSPEGQVERRIAEAEHVVRPVLNDELTDQDWTKVNDCDPAYIATIPPDAIPLPTSVARIQQVLFLLNLERVKAKQLEKQLEGQRKEVTDLRADVAKKSEAIERLQNELRSKMSAYTSDAAKQALMMSLVQKDDDIVQQKSKSLENKLERVGTYEVKSQLTMNLLNSELLATQSKAHTQEKWGLKLEAEVAMLHETLATTQQRVAALEAELDAAAQHSQAQQSELRNEVLQQKRRAEQLSHSWSRVNKEVDEAKTEAIKWKLAAAKHEQTLQEREAFWKQESMQLKALALQDTREANKKERELYERLSSVQSELESQKIQMAELEVSDGGAIQKAEGKITSLQAEVELWRSRYEHATKEIKELQQVTSETSTRYSSELGAAISKNDKAKDEFETKQREFFARTVDLTTECNSLKQQVAHLKQLCAKKDKDYVEEVQRLNTLLEDQKSQSAKAQRELEQKLKIKEAKEHQLVLQVNKLQDDHAAYVAALKQQQQEDQEEGDKYERMAKEAAAENARLKEEMAQVENKAWEQRMAHNQEVLALRDEIREHEGTAEKLQAAIAEGLHAKLLAEENALLKADVEDLHTQIKHLKNALSAMKLEVDILDVSKGKAPQGENTHLQQRVQQLEQERRMVMPLVSELMATLNKHGLTSTLKADIEDFKVAFLTHKASNPPRRFSGALTSPAAMGRHKIDPLPPSPPSSAIGRASTSYFSAY